MELVGVGRGREVAPLPLPPFAPAGAPAPMVRPGRDVVRTAPPQDAGSTGPAPVECVARVAHVPDDGGDPVGAELAALAEDARVVTAASARLDARLAAAYLWGAAELAARCSDPDPRRRREWGARGMLAELAATLHQAEGAVARRLTRITMLTAFPRLVAAHTAGVVSGAHVGAVLDVFHAVTDQEVLADADAALEGRARELTVPQLRAAARRWRARHVPVTQEQHARAVADRFVAVSPADDDLCWLTALLPAPAAHGVMHRVDELAAAVSGPDEPRTLPQLRADVLCDLLLDPGVPHALVPRGQERGAERGWEHGTDGARLVQAALAEGGDVDVRGRRAGVLPDPSEPRSDCVAPGAQAGGMPGWVRHVVPHVVLTVPVLSLLGRGDEQAELDGFGPIDLDTARALCANAPSFTRVLTHPETGTVLSVGRRQHAIPTDLRRAVNLRDGTCRFPGCRRRAARCDVDHTTAWADGGHTAVDNLATVCAKHHQLKHRTGWTSTLHADGSVEWESPTGRHYFTRPAVLLLAARPPESDGARPPTGHERAPDGARPPTRHELAPDGTRPSTGHEPAPDGARPPARHHVAPALTTRASGTTGGYADVPPF